LLLLLFFVFFVVVVVTAPVPIGLWRRSKRRNLRQ
jgi:hypothetical protein